MEFQSFGKIARLKRDIVITEKIDGTNAQVAISLASDAQKAGHLVGPFIACVDDYVICAGSRNRWITPENDNYGFAKWVKENTEELVHLGEGRHFGEWWGKGIQCGYNMDRKVFSLFNTKRWNAQNVPNCCSVVPVLYEGIFDQTVIDLTLESLRVNGSVASPGFMKPEGIMIYHTASGTYFKYTLGGDGHKG
jgi:hypothetical protein